jgi:hypothetical protein
MPTADRELGVMQEAFAALTGLDPAARQRVMNWLNERFPAWAVSLPYNPPDTVAEFVEDKQPASAMERITCLVFWATAVCGQRAVLTRELNELNRLAGGNTFSDAGSVGQSVLASRGYLIRTGTPGQWQLTPAGKALVNALPDREAVRAQEKSSA